MKIKYQGQEENVTGKDHNALISRQHTLSNDLQSLKDQGMSEILSNIHVNIKKWN